MKRVLFMTMAALLFTTSVGGAQTLHDADQTSAAAVMSRFDRGIVKAFREAWQRAAIGTLAIEAVVLILRNADGSCKATLPQPTNENRRLTFHWQPGTIAVVHTHPNSNSPRPSPADIEIAERFHVPMFTLTIKGMFLYDPATKVISMVQPGIDWMDEAKWTRYAPVMAAQPAGRQ